MDKIEELKVKQRRRRSSSGAYRRPLIKAGSLGNMKMKKLLPKIFPIFGKDLKKVIKKEWLAAFVFNSTGFIEKNPQEGIFRMPADKSMVEDFSHKINNGYCLDDQLLEEIKCSNTVCDLLKIFTRTMPVPLLEIIFTEFLTKISIEDIKKEGFMDKAIASIKKNLKEYEIILLYKLIHHFNCVSNLKVTRMKAHSLSVIFTPNLYTRDLFNFIKNNDNYQKALQFLSFLIENQQNFKVLDNDHDYFKDPQKAFYTSLTK